MRFILSIFFLFLCNAITKAQESYFYHTTGEETVSLSIVNNKYLIEFTDTSTAPDTFQAVYIYPNLYEVSDTNDLDTLVIAYKIHPVYSLDEDKIYVTNHIFIKFKEEVSFSEKTVFINNNHIELVDSNEVYERYKITNNANTLSLCNYLFNTGLVDICYPDFLITMIPGSITDPFYGKQYYLKNTGQIINDGKSGTAGADIKIEGAWSLNKGNSNIIIAVIDKGVSSDHPDLPNTRQVRLNGSNISPYLYGNNNPDDPSPEEMFFKSWNHGNACAGIIAATHNSEGIAGIAPDCKIMPIRIDLGAPLPESDFVKAINLAVDNGAKIINCSWAANSINATLSMIKLAVKNGIGKGVFFAFITHNTAQHSIGNAGFVAAPGDEDIAGAMTVGASNRYDKQADYSPNSQWVEIVAPSSHTGGFRSSSEAEDMWTIDIPGMNGLNPYREVGATSTTLPQEWEFLPNTGTHNDAYTGRFSGTSAAAPQVAGVAALMLTENNCLSPIQIEDILVGTADRVGDYKYSLYNSRGYFPGRSKELGYGRLNAENAVKAARSFKKTTLDLYMKDDVRDLGYNRTYGTDFSPDIWLRNQDDGLINKVSEQLNYLPNTLVYVYVRIRNKSCVNYTPGIPNTAKINIFWSKASSMSSWPSHWDGTKPSIGNIIAYNQTIPAISASGETIMKFTWQMPTQINSGGHRWKICFLARIDGLASTDPIVSFPGNFPMEVGVNNNVTLLNTWITNLTNTGTAGLSPYNGKIIYFPKGGKVRLGNPSDATTSYNFRFEVPPFTAPNITDYTEVKLIFDNAGWQIFQNSNAFEDVDGIKILGDGIVALTKPAVSFNNISFPADSSIDMYLGFGHWSDSILTDTVWYDYRLTQSLSSEPDTVLGSCNFQIIAHPRNAFSVNASADQNINKGQTAILSATDIGEDALYLWYDANGNLIDSVREIEVQPDTTTNYKLEIIATRDGFKGYDQVLVNVKQYFITCISPNPATTSVTVQYDVTNATTASLVFTPITSGPAYSYSLNTALTTKTVNTTGFAIGNYIVTLVCNGNTSDSKGLIIN